MNEHKHKTREEKQACMLAFGECWRKPLPAKVELSKYEGLISPTY